MRPLVKKLIELHHQFTQPTPLASTYNPSQFPESFYFFSALDSIVVRDTLTDEATIFNSLNTSNSFLTIIDTDNNHGVANNGFGLLDDVYKLDLVDLSVTCSNTVTVIENTTESLIYDFACDCIQDGEVVMEIPGLCSCDYPRYDYGYVDPSTGQSSGECDDLIRCYTQGISFAPTNNTAGTRSPCSPATQEIINCL